MIDTTLSDKIDHIPMGWHQCPDCRKLLPSKEEANNCCKGRHSSKTKVPTLIDRINGNYTS